MFSRPRRSLQPMTVSSRHRRASLLRNRSRLRPHAFSTLRVLEALLPTASVARGHPNYCSLSSQVHHYRVRALGGEPFASRRYGISEKAPHAASSVSSRFAQLGGVTERTRCLHYCTSIRTGRKTFSTCLREAPKQCGWRWGMGARRVAWRIPSRQWSCDCRSGCPVQRACCSLAYDYQTYHANDERDEGISPSHCVPDDATRSRRVHIIP